MSSTRGSRSGAARSSDRSRSASPAPSGSRGSSPSGSGAGTQSGRGPSKTKESSIKYYAQTVHELKDKEWDEVRKKAEKILSGRTGGKCHVVAHADGRNHANLDCRVPSESVNTTYTQSIVLNSSGSRVVSHTCDCPGAKKSERKKDAVCKHVVAALLKHVQQCSSQGSSQPRSSLSGSTPSRSAAYPTQSGSSGGGRSNSGGSGACWGLLEPKNTMEAHLRRHGGSYFSVQKEFEGMIELHGAFWYIGKTDAASINLVANSTSQGFPTVSSKHGMIKADLNDIHKPNWGKKFTALFEDTSTNGSYLNGKLYKKNTFKELQEGDEITLGKEKDTSFVFVSLGCSACVSPPLLCRFGLCCDRRLTQWEMPVCARAALPVSVPRRLDPGLLSAYRAAREREHWKGQAARCGRRGERLRRRSLQQLR